jgi:hypothetical protein
LKALNKEQNVQVSDTTMMTKVAKARLIKNNIVN